MQLTFSVDDFVPEFFSFRLRHPQYENLSEAVLAEWSESDGQYNAFIDLAEPVLYILARNISSIFQETINSKLSLAMIG